MGFCFQKTLGAETEENRKNKIYLSAQDMDPHPEGVAKLKANTYPEVEGMELSPYCSSCQARRSMRPEWNWASGRGIKETDNPTRASEPACNRGVIIGRAVDDHRNVDTDKCQHKGEATNVGFPCGFP